jgi:hypothetical protein
MKRRTAWRRRWLLNRIQNDEVLDRVGKLGPESVRAELWTDETGQFKLPLDCVLPLCRIACPYSNPPKKAGRERTNAD